MHKKILKHATDSQIKEFVTDFLTMLKSTHPDLYETAEHSLYEEVYGCHFTDWSLECALENLVNEDGTTGPHWTLEQTTRIAEERNLILSTYNNYDWCFVMNMMYSDYYKVIGNDTSVYTNMSKHFLMDKDAVDGKAYKYYMTMRK